MGGLNSSTKHNTLLNMKFLVLAACVAISSAALVTYPNGAVVHAVPYPYLGNPALVTHPNGAVVPADTAEIYAAKAAHAAAGGVINPVGVSAGLVSHPNGAVVPIEPADVLAARAAHLAAVAAA